MQVDPANLTTNPYVCGLALGVDPLRSLCTMSPAGVRLRLLRHSRRQHADVQSKFSPTFHSTDTDVVVPWSGGAQRQRILICNALLTKPHECAATGVHG
jgi:hypothetical protein